MRKSFKLMNLRFNRPDCFVSTGVFPSYTQHHSERLHKMAEVLSLSSLSPQTLIFSAFLVAFLLLAGISI
jgi:hypothetical protein